MSTYTYGECLQNSYRVNWKISDVIGGRAFDRSRPWLPARLSGASSVRCLGEIEKIKLTHVEMGSYAHLFGFVEEYIAPKMITLAHDFELTNHDAFDALTNFAATLPAPQSDLARDLLKDPYNYDFLMLSRDAQEKHLQTGLLVAR